MSEAATRESPVTITRYPAARGAAWLRESYAMLGMARIRWLALLAIYWLVLTIVELLPGFGHAAALVLKPVFAVGFLAAAWAQERGELPTPRHLFQGFQANLWALIPLGLFLFVGIRLSVEASALVDDGKLLQLLEGAPLDRETVTAGDLQKAMLMTAACAMPVILAAWYAPALVVFHGLGPLRALALSLKAILANWRAFAVYALLLTFYGLVVPLMALMIAVMLLPANYATQVAVIALMPYFALLLATLNISDYVSYRDIFHAGEKAARVA